MKNLAGVKEADESIQEELLLAGINIVKGELNKGEVPYSITGKIGNWTLERAWTYWVMSASKGEGLTINVATNLHEKKYPISGERQPKTFGQVIRVTGHCGCPPPNEWAKPYDAQGLELVLDPEGKQEKEYKAFMKTHPEMQKTYEKLRFVPNLDGVVAKSVIDSYHIDSQVGLNEFAKVVKEI